MNSLAIRDSQMDDDIAEDLRLAALDAFDVLDTPHEEGLDGIARLIRNVFDVPVAIVSVIDAHRQWYKACEGLTNTEQPRKDTLCDVTIRQSRPLVVTDALADARFARHPAVTGEPRIRFYAGVPLRTRDGHAIGTLCAIDFKPREFGQKQVEILTDLARVAMAEFEMRKLVTIDALTGVQSRRALRQEGERAMALARRHELEMSCIAVELDGLKAIAKTHGQDQADAALAGVAAKFRSVLRRTDHMGRLSGEEFAVVLPNTDRDGALGAAEKLRATLAAMTLDVGGMKVRLTATFGAATMDPDTDDFDALFARADAALHRARASGGNRCFAWNGPEGAEHGARRRVLKAGTIDLDDAAPLLDATIRFLSEDGAGIDVSTTAGIPDRFTLSINSDASVMACRVVSRTDCHLEVEFR